MCSRVIWIGKEIEWADDGTPLIVGRNMDWSEEMYSNLWVFPRGGTRESVFEGGKEEWVSRYGSIMATSYGYFGEPDGGTTDGMNEQGLAGSLLWLTESDFTPRIRTGIRLAMSVWLQYYLDNYASVADLVKDARDTPPQVIPALVAETGCVGSAHMALSDEHGETAVIEYLTEGCSIYYSGDLADYRGRFSVMTNSPTYRE